MIGYTTVGTNDLETAATFYDKLFGIIEAKRMFEFDSFIAWGKSDGNSMFSIHIPHDGKPSTVGNGVMIALNVGNKELVDSIYNKALENGAIDEGAPGYRMDNFYAAYFRDLDGNKLNVHFMGE